MAMSGKAYSVFIATNFNELVYTRDGVTRPFAKELLNPRNRTQEIPPDETLISCKYDSALNSAGSCTFVMPPKHPYISDIKPMITQVAIAEIDNFVWIGRVTDTKTDFYGRLEVHCEGAFAFLNDSIQDSVSYKNLTPAEYLTKLLALHNGCVHREDKIIIDGELTSDISCKISIGEVYSDNVTVSETLNYESTMDAVQKFLEKYGGYVSVMLDDNGLGLYLNYYGEGFSRDFVSEQSVEFAKNLLTFSKTVDYVDVCTSIIPLGADVEMEILDTTDDGEQIYVDDDGSYLYRREEQIGETVVTYYVDENDERVTPSGSVTEATKIIEVPLNLAMEEDTTVQPDEDGIKPLRFAYSEDYINIKSDGISPPNEIGQKIASLLLIDGSHAGTPSKYSDTEYGRIVRTVTFNDAYDVETLRNKANEWLGAHEDIGEIVIDVTAADLRFLNASEGNLYLGMSVPVNFPSRVTDSFIITKIEADIVKVSKKITLGRLPKKTLSDMVGRGKSYSTGVKLKKTKSKKRVTAKDSGIWFIPK